MKLLKILTSLVFALSLNISLNAKEIKMGKADWDTGYFQAEVYKKALEKMGYKVTGPTVMKPQVFYVAAAAGDVGGPATARVGDDSAPIGPTSSSRILQTSSLLD